MSGRGFLFIGDPHLAGRSPAFRKDDFGRTILDKIAWCLDYARENGLVPVFLGDLFDRPRDNPTWVVGRLLELLRGAGALAIYGNHDCAQPSLDEHDTLSLLPKAQVLRLLGPDAPWRGTLNGREVILGGSSYRQKIPDRYPPDPVPDDAAAASVAGESGKKKRGKKRAKKGENPLPDAPADVAVEADAPLVIWVAHHDLAFPGYVNGRHGLKERPGVDAVVNGHIHRRFEPQRVGRTIYLGPGNIARRVRPNPGFPAREPAALRLDIPASGRSEAFEPQWIAIPHAPAGTVFHEAVEDAPASGEGLSRFVAGLAELEARRTEGGGGLLRFLEENYTRFPTPVAGAIAALARSILAEDA